MRARRRFGQNFLRDKNIIAAVIAAVSPAAKDNIIEIGPGDGALTASLLASQASVTAVEIDRDCAALLRKKFADSRLKLLNNDVLRESFSQFGDSIRLVGNLPYNISTPFLLKMSNESKCIKDAYLMLQKEVGERLCAPIGSTCYGRLSVSVGRLFAPKLLFEVSAAAFSPEPKVQSVLLRFRPLKNPPPWSPTAEKVLRAAFQSRRKTLANALKTFSPDWATSPIDGLRRAETLSVADFSNLAAHIENTDIT